MKPQPGGEGAEGAHVRRRAASVGHGDDWIIEGYGVDADIQVVDDPGVMAQGGDPQLDRAIEEVLAGR